ncbi:MAG: GHKL domain-containing protein [Sedimentisphaerales bacterium]|nr:GHKL domain-containing protein [Sedimentisphaerales bacterium]
MDNPPVNVSLEELAREAVELNRGKITAKKIQVEIHPDLPVITGDRGRLLAVMQNLVDNAVKYMGDQKAPLIEIGVRRQDDETICYVKDNGIGVDPRYHENVFGLFEQLDKSYEGTGVGLAIVKRIIDIHGGRIWVESQGQGKGATFCFTLPPKIKSPGI